jgi:intraflagellar transport protein 122
MLCYAGNGQLFIKSGDFAAHPLPMEGDVVGFAGSKVFVLQYFGARPEMRVVDVRCSCSDRDCYFKAIMTALFAYFTAMF